MMATLKCKMCGGDLNVEEGATVCECEYCGTKQTVPKLDDEKKMKLFERANRLRAACEFDKAAGVYESLVADFDQEAEAYWGLILCKFGIEYVDDPATGDKIPTCHRSSFDSLMDDPNFEMVMECADPVARRVYREEAKTIEELRKRIIEVSSKEEPYDVFISYKELDDNGERTLDSVIAQDIYTELTEKGYRVFFSRISLESKLGVEYEPYIFAALNSAKVMLVVGTDYDYFNAVWVKNEWNRFLAQISSGQKKTLIPVFKGIDAYDMPKEFAKLAAQDMGKVGAMQDLVRGIGKLVPLKKKDIVENTKKETVAVHQETSPSIDSLLDRGKIALEDEEWEKAQELYDKILNVDPRNASAYIGLVMAECQFRNFKALRKVYLNPEARLCENKRLIRARQFGSEEIQKMFSDLDSERKTILETKRRSIQKEAEKKAELQRREKERNAENLRRSIEEKSYELQPKRDRVLLAKNMVSVGSFHTVALKSNGTVVATGRNDSGQCNVEGWNNIIAISTGEDHTVGLKKNGTVVATKYIGDPEKYCGQCEVNEWKEIIAISAGAAHTVGLKKDGTVIATGDNEDGQCNVKQWKNIVAISAGIRITVGLKKDGTVVAVGNNRYGECNVENMSDIVSVAARSGRTVGIRADGALIATKNTYVEKIKGFDHYPPCGWKDLLCVDIGYYWIAAIRSDFTVAVMGTDFFYDQEVSEWTDIVGVAVGLYHMVGLRANGTLVAVGQNKEHQCDVDRWKLFDNVNTIETDRKSIEIKQREKKALLEKERSELQAELLNLKGLFSGLKKSRIEDRLAEIEKEMKE